MNDPLDGVEKMARLARCEEPELGDVSQGLLARIAKEEVYATSITPMLLITAAYTLMASLITAGIVLNIQPYVVDPLGPWFETVSKLAL